MIYCQRFKLFEETPTIHSDCVTRCGTRLHHRMHFFNQFEELQITLNSCFLYKYILMKTELLST